MGVVMHRKSTENTAVLQGERGERGRGEGKGREGRRENDLTHPLSQIPGYATAHIRIDTLFEICSHYFPFVTLFTFLILRKLRFKVIPTIMFLAFCS